MVHRCSRNESLPTDIVAALTDEQRKSGAGISVDFSIPEMVPVGTPPATSSCAVNHTDEPTRLTIHYTLQRDASLYSRPLADPIFGSDHAARCRSWLVVDGEIVNESGSTDGKPWTSASTSWQREHYTEAFQLVDLGQVARDPQVDLAER